MKVLDENIRTIVREQAEAGHEGRQVIESPLIIEIII